MKLHNTCRGFACALLNVNGLLLLSGYGTTGSENPSSTISQCARAEGEVCLSCGLRSAAPTDSSYRSLHGTKPKATVRLSGDCSMVDHSTVCACGYSGIEPVRAGSGPCIHDDSLL